MSRSWPRLSCARRWPKTAAAWRRSTPTDPTRRRTDGDAAAQATLGLLYAALRIIAEIGDAWIDPDRQTAAGIDVSIPLSTPQGAPAVIVASAYVITQVSRAWLDRQR